MSACLCLCLYFLHFSQVKEARNRILVTFQQKSYCVKYILEPRTGRCIFADVPFLFENELKDFPLHLRPLLRVDYEADNSNSAMAVDSPSTPASPIRSSVVAPSSFIDDPPGNLPLLFHLAL